MGTIPFGDTWAENFPRRENKDGEERSSEGIVGMGMEIISYPLFHENPVPEKFTKIHFIFVIFIYFFTHVHIFFICDVMS